MTRSTGHLVVTGSMQALPEKAHREWGIESRETRDGPWAARESDPAWTRDMAVEVMRRWYRAELEHGMARIVTRMVSAWVEET